MEESFLAGLFANDSVLVENEGCCKFVDEFDRMSKRRTFRVNASKSKVIHCMVFEEQESKSSILQSPTDLRERARQNT